jgi:flagellar biosynthesis/type III secretory pathway protein FliH
VKDLSLNPTDCIIETPYGNIDCSLERQMQDLIENLYYIYEQNGG